MCPAMRADEDLLRQILRSRERHEALEIGEDICAQSSQPDIQAALLPTLRGREECW